MPDNSFTKMPFSQKTAYSRNNPESSIFPSPVQVARAPTTTDTNYVLGQVWVDTSVAPANIYEYAGGGVWETGSLPSGTDGQLFVGVTGGNAVFATAGSALGSITNTLGAGTFSQDISENWLQVATVNVPTAEVLAMATTPITLVAAPGAGKFIEFISAQIILDYNSIAYTESGDNMAVRYTDGSGVVVSAAIESTNFIDATADTITNAIPVADAIVAATGAVNQALVLDNTGNNFAAGNSDLIVKVAYRVITTGL